MGNDKLKPLAEGWGDPTPSVLLGDLDITDSSTADNSSNNKENLSIAMTKSSKTTGSSLKTKQVYRLGKKIATKPAITETTVKSVADISVTSSKARVPAWMQASQEDEAEADDEIDEFLELEKQAEKMVQNENLNTAFVEPVGKLRTASFAGASSKGSKKMPAWMSQQNDDDEDLDNLDNTLRNINDTQLAVL